MFGSRGGVKRSGKRGRNAMPLHELLRENFRGFELRGFLVGSPNAKTFFLK